MSFLNGSGLMQFASVNRTSSFDPSSVSGLIGWWKADAGITKDGGNLVSNWADQSGNSNDLAQGTGTNQPLWVDNNRASKPTINFDGIDNFMKVTSFSGGALSQPYTVFLALKEPSADNMGIITQDDANDPRFRTLATADYDISNQAVLVGGTTDPSVWHYYTILWNGASSDLRRDASSVLSGNAGAGGTWNGITLGALSGGGYGDAQIGEVLIYNANISGGDRTNIETYLATRWGL